VAPEELSANLYAFITLSLAELWQWYRVLPKETCAHDEHPGRGKPGCSMDPQLERQARGNAAVVPR
jgi:hypothetical protein